MVLGTTKTFLISSGNSYVLMREFIKLSTSKADPLSDLRRHKRDADICAAVLNLPSLALGILFAPATC